MAGCSPAPRLSPHDLCRTTVAPKSGVASVKVDATEENSQDCENKIAIVLFV